MAESASSQTHQLLARGLSCVLSVSGTCRVVGVAASSRSLFTKSSPLSTQEGRFPELARGP